MVYPGALHTRFHHALGAMHLMGMAIDVLRSKGVEISHEEEVAALVAILLHDIGHGPYSHALESTLIKGVSHEQLSLMMMEALDQEFHGQLGLAIEIFKGTGSKPFLHQLVNSQLDTDRLDYLTRDSFFTGVSEGVIGTERIIKMLNVADGQLVVDEKGIYSIEKFLVSRRLMYWQVYLHKTVLSAENLMIRILNRAKFLAEGGTELESTGTLKYFMYEFIKESSDPIQMLKHFGCLDDYDVLASIKSWIHSDDRVLSLLSKALINRKLFKVELSSSAIPSERFNQQKEKVSRLYHFSDEEAKWMVIQGETSNQMYVSDSSQIKILTKDGVVVDLLSASDQLNYIPLGKVVKKYFLCYPKDDATL